MSAVLDSPHRFVTARAYGAFVPEPPDVVTTEGEWVETGQLLGTIRTSHGDVPIVSPWRGWVVAYLVADGERVRPGAELVHVVEA